MPMTNEPTQESFDGPKPYEVQTPTMTQTVPVYKADDPTPALSTRVLPRPRVVPFKPKPKTEVDQVLDEVRSNARDIVELVVLYRTRDGGITVGGNQGDTAGNLLFVEKAKILFLKDDKPPTGSQAG